MKLTSDAASKRLKSLQEDYDILLQEQAAARAVSMPMEDYRKAKEAGREFKKEFDFCGMQRNLVAVQREIEHLKHSINVFNATTVLPKHNVTIDQALVRMAFLSKRKKVLFEMRAIADVTLPSHRFMSHEITTAEICAFDQTDAKMEYRSVCDELSALQQELNYVNVTVEFDYEPYKP